MISFLSLPGLCSRPFESKVHFVVAALACGLGLCGVTADAQCSGSGSNYATTTYTFSGTEPANKVVGGGGVSVISTSTITVPSFPSGSVVTCVSVYLNGVTSDGIDKAPDGYEYASMDYAAMMLTAPSGQKFEFLGGTGDGTDGYDGNGQSGPYGLNNLNITVWDGASSHAPGFPTSSGWQNNCTSTACPVVKSASYFIAAGDGNPSLGGSSQWAVNDGTATFASTIENQATPNGTWTLSLNDDDPYTKGDPVTINSWSLVLTVEQTANLNTTTTLSSSSTNNTSFTGGSNSSVTLTATVKAGTEDVTSGTVKFLNGTSTISGCSAVALNGSGEAACITSFSTEGIQGLSAAFATETGYNGSTSSTLNQYVKNHSTLSNGEYCNTGAISINGPVTSPYPSVINVGTDTTALTGTVADLTVTLNGLASTTGLGQGYAFLLVAPDTSKVYNLDFLASAGSGGPQSSANVTIEDDYPLAPASGELSGTYAATDLNTSADDFAAAISPAPALPATDNYAQPEYFDPSGALTLAQAFGGANGNGNWTLYAFNEESDLITVNSGWCLSFTQNTGTVTTTALASSANPAYTGNPVTITATVTSNGTPVTSGNVTFTENGAAPAGVTNNVVALNGSGQAAITTNALVEGDHDIVATYSGIANTWDTSYASLWEREDAATTASGLGTSGSPAKFCNTAGFVIPSAAESADNIGAANPNPTNVFVNSLPGTNSSVAIELDGFHDPTDGGIGDTASLIVGPNGAGLDFFSGTGVTNVTTLAAGNYIFNDTASGTVPQTAFGPGTYQPTSYDTTDTFFANPSGIYALPTTLDYAAPHSDAFTFNTDNSEGNGAFSSLSGNGNGTWSLYFNQNTHASGAGATGWCMDFVQNLPTASVSLSSNSTFTQGAAESFSVDVTNDGPGSTGDLNGTSLMTVTDTLNSAFTFTSGSGTAWSCSNSGQTVTCTNAIPVAETESYPALTLNVSVGSNASGPYSNTVTASGAGVSSTTSNTDNVTVDVPPAITSGNSVTFTAGTLGSWEITATGYPTPTYSESGALPGGITLNSSEGILAGTANAGTGGTWPIVITASNGANPDATQNFTLTIDQAPAITSASGTTFTAGSMGSFTVAASGYPAPSFTESGTLPSGVTMSSSGVLSGIPAASTNGTYTYPITITTTNGIGTNATQNFTLTVNQAPAFTGGNSATMKVLTNNAYLIFTSGYPTASITESGALPSGVTFVDDGNGHGTLSGEPGATTGGLYPLTFTANNGISPNGALNYTLTIDQPSSITSASGVTFTTGTAGSFTVTTAGYPLPSTFTETGTLPTGVTFVNNGNGTATLSGTPNAGTAGTYSLSIDANNGTGGQVQTFTLTVFTPQTITFPQPATPATNGTSVTLTASASSGLPITYSVVSGPATVSGSTLTYTGMGTVVIEADQPGNSTYLPAPAVQQTVTVVDVYNYAAPTTPVNSTSATETAIVNFTTGGTVGSINVLTQGAANMDFNLVSGGSCAIGTAYTAGQACTVDYSFTPAAPGGRNGAVVLQDGSGNVLGTSYIGGVGTGPEGLFTAGILANVASGLDIPRGVSLDGAGNIYVVEQGNSNVDEFAAQTGAETVLSTAGNSPAATVVDGAGNIYFSSTSPAAIYELVGGTPVEIASGWTPDDVLVVDGAGNLYSSDENTGAIYEIAAGTYQTTVALPSGTIGRIIGMTVDASGNLYAADFNNSVMYEVVAGSGTATELFSGNGLSNPHGLTIDPAGNLYVTNYTGGAVQKYTNVAGAWVDTPLPTGSNGTRGITIDGSGNLYMLTDSTIYEDSRTTTSLSFGPQVQGTQSAAQATGFENDGNASLAISALGVTGTSFTEDSGTTTCSTTTPLAVAGTCNVGAAFIPQSASSLSGALTLTDNNLNQPGSSYASQSITLQGTGLAAAPIATLSASSLSYGSQEVGVVSASQQVTLQNTGSLALSITRIAVTGANASSFVFANTCGGSLAAGATCTIHGHFTPTTTGALSAAVTITDNAGDSPQSIALSGNGTAPAVSLSSTSLSYGNQEVGTLSASQSVTLTNTGESSLSITSIAVTGADASSFVFANNCGTSLADGASCTIHGHFTPTTTGALSAAVTITDNAGDSPQSIALSGNGTVPAVSLSSTSLAYGNQEVETLSASQSVTLTNTGGSSMSITSIAVTGTNASSFDFGNNCGTSLASGATCTIHGHFTPTTTGALSAAITITDNASGSPQSVALSGTGVTGPAVSLSAASLSYASQTVETTSPSQSVTLTNTGGSSLSIVSIAVTGANASSFDFGNNCGTSLASGATCTIHGHFTPTTTGALSAAVTITDNAGDSPQTIALSGTGQ